MKPTKIVKDHLIKLLLGNSAVPSGLVEFHQYFRQYGSIHFHYEKVPEGLVARSTDFRFGSIITSGKNQEELDKNIKDAILTSFEIPSSYADQAQINKVGEAQESVYAAA